jgi:hypothetical protein
LLIETFQGRIINHVLAFLAEHHAKLCIDTCKLLGGKYVRYIKMRTESVVFIVKMFDDMVVLPATGVGTVKANKRTRCC